MIAPEELRAIASWSRDLSEAEFEEARRGTSLVVTPTGRLDSGSAPDFEARLGEDIDGERHVGRQHARKVGSRLDAGGGVDLAADVLDLRGDLEGAAPPGSLERHVLQQVGHAVLFVALVAGTGLYPHTQRDGFDIRKGFGCDCQAVRQTAYLYTHKD